MADSSSTRSRDPVSSASASSSSPSSPSSSSPPAPAAGLSARLRALRVPLVAAGLAILLALLATPWARAQPPADLDYTERTRRILQTTPLIDGHNDLPWQLRIELHNRLAGVDLTQQLLGHTDLQRMRQGMVGGQFWSVYVECDGQQDHFDDPSWAVRDTLEQIDVTRRFIDEHPQHLAFCATAACARRAFTAGRIASMIGIEGGHQVGSSLAALRQMYDLGARYLTLTHNCDNAFATSTSTVAAGGPDHGLAALGYEAVREMNRLGMMVDLSHVSHQTMRDVLRVARAPVVFSHSGAYSVEPHLRHVPDDVLAAVRANGGIVMVVFVNRFLNMHHPEQASIYDVVEHVLHIAHTCGWSCVGIGSDFSGTPYVPVGLEDVSKFPDLLALLMARGVTDDQIRLLAGENILRVWEAVEQRARALQAAGETPSEAEYGGRAWHKGLRDAPWMLPGSRDKASAWGAAKKPYMFHVDDEGKHNPAVKQV